MLDSPELKERFLVEAQAAAALNHPNICVIHEVGESEDRPYIAMEFVDGETLRDKLRRGPLKVDEALAIAVQIAAGLGEAHRKAIVHRDVKSANIMITTSGQAKVMDFGLAKVRGGSSLTKSQTTIGTVAYMSPEQAQGEDLDPRTDLWSLGVVLYEMLTGELPFKGDRDLSVIYSIVHAEPRSLKVRKPPVPEEMQQVVAKALKKRRDARYGSADEMLKDLKAYQAALQTDASGVSEPENARPAPPQAAGRRADGRRARAPGLCRRPVLQAPSQGPLGPRRRHPRSPEAPRAERLLAQSRPRLRPGREDRGRHPEGPPARRDPCPMRPERESSRPSLPAPRSFSRNTPPRKANGPCWGSRRSRRSECPSASSAGRSRRTAMKRSSRRPRLGAFLPTRTSSSATNDLTRVLDKKGALPPGMVRVKGEETPLGKLPDFFIDRCEVTNRQFKEFVAAGGYREKRFWTQKFIRDGRELTWEEAVKRFVDQTGLPGPSTWQAGDYPEGQGDYPVSGVSWYEAAAYAEFAGKSLPTGEHWGIARGEYTTLIQVPQLGGFAILAPFSNFRGKGPVPAGSLPGLTAYGALDMAGNVREWCWNETPNGRLIRGGAWDDNPYMFGFLSQAPAMDRSPRNGFRCAVYPDRKASRLPRSNGRSPSKPRTFIRKSPSPMTFSASIRSSSPMTRPT